VVERETIALAFIAALRVLPPRQRAALISRDVLGWSASQTAGLLQTSVAAANSALQRGDIEAAAAIAASDIRVTMPPYPMRFDGIDGLRPLLVRAFGPDRDGDWRLVPTSANRTPDAASYLRRPGDSEFRAFKLDVLRIEDGAIAEITTFGCSLFGQFGLPATV
jgi:RNA polymerase sigma-70 factor (ECF subfamily)